MSVSRSMCTTTSDRHDPPERHSRPARPRSHGRGAPRLRTHAGSCPRGRPTRLWDAALVRADLSRRLLDPTDNPDNADIASLADITHPDEIFPADFMSRPCPWGVAQLHTESVTRREATFVPHHSSTHPHTHRRDSCRCDQFIHPEWRADDQQVVDTATRVAGSPHPQSLRRHAADRPTVRGGR